MYDTGVNQKDVTGNTCSSGVVQECTQNVEEVTKFLRGLPGVHERLGLYGPEEESCSCIPWSSEVDLVQIGRSTCTKLSKWKEDN
jgi:hypothetical protein